MIYLANFRILSLFVARQANLCLEHSIMTSFEPFIGARDLAFCLKVPLDSLLV